MKLFTYRGRQRMKHTAGLLAIVLALLCLVVVVSFLYLERYMVYTEDGAYLELSDETDAAEETDSSEDYTLSELPDGTLEVIYGQAVDSAAQSENNDQTATEDESEMVALSGYYVAYDDLSDPEAVLDAITADEDCNAVMLEVKSEYGTSFYTSNLADSSLSESLDVSAVDSLIATLDTDGYFLIALLPAYCDSIYALAHQSEGLQITGGALWMDWDSYYWLDPASETVQAHLVELCTELNELGFDEIAFSDFTFPDSENILYDSGLTRNEALIQAGDLLTKTMDLLNIPVSFCDLSLDGSIISPTENGHLLFLAEDGGTVSEVLNWLSDDPDLEDRLVFCTDSHDTRFADYTVLRPVSIDQS